MKKIIALFFPLLWCALFFVSCEAPDELSLDEQITVGMGYSDVVEIVGTGTQCEIAPNVYIYNTGDEKNLYVWLNRLPDDPLATVTRVERRAELLPAEGMTREEINALLGSVGSVYNPDANIYVWPSANESKALYAWLDKQEKMVRYTISVPPKYTLGMSYDEINSVTPFDGEAVPYVLGLHRWPLGVKDRYLYARILDGKATQFFYDGDVAFDDKNLTPFTPGVSYDRLVEIYGMQGKLVSRRYKIYSWQTADSKIGLFKFEEYQGGEIRLVQFDLNVGFVDVGMTLDELNESLGAVGENAGINTTTVYKWETDLDENLYIWLDSDMTAARISCEVDLEIEIGMAREDVYFILGDPISNTVCRRWVNDDETDLYLLFCDGFLDAMCYVPRIDVYEGMTMNEIVELMGREHDSTFGSGNIHYVWILGEYDIFVAFDYDGKANNVGFRLIEN